MRGVTVFDQNARAYDRWFDENERVYRAELDAVQALLPPVGLGLEVGVGTGHFAAPLSVRFGVDPARNAACIARDRGVLTCQSFGERLPFRAGQFDYALLVTVDPFVLDVSRVLREVRRVLKPGGWAIVGVIDRDSPLGQMYEAHKDDDLFYREAHFHSAGEMIALLGESGLCPKAACQTITGFPNEDTTTEQVQEGYEGETGAFAIQAGHGEGAFVVLSAEKTFKNGVRWDK